MSTIKVPVTVTVDDAAIERVRKLFNASIARVTAEWRMPVLAVDPGYPLVETRDRRTTK